MDGAAGSPAGLAGMIVAGLAAAYVAVQASLVRLEEHHAASLALGFFVPVAALLGGAIGILAERTVSAFYIGSALGSVVCLFVLLVARVGHHNFERDRSTVANMLRLLAPFILIAVLAWLGGYGNTYLVELFFEPFDVASFTFVYSLSAIMQLVATSMNQVWSPRFYRLVNDSGDAEAERFTRRFTIAQGLALGVTGAAGMLAVTPAIDLAGGNLIRYRGLHLELFLLFAAYAVAIPWWHAQNYYYAHGRGRELLRVSIVSSLTGLALWVGCALAFGTLGAYLGFFMQMLSRSVFALARARREWKIRVSWEGPLLALSGMLAGLALTILLFGSS
jgi:O-antigen/teichoic acid export membrane protein